MRETITIKYILKSTDMDFTVDLFFDKKDFSLLNLNAGENDWTRLAFHKCLTCYMMAVSQKTRQVVSV